MFLSLLLGEKAILLNRAAAAEPTGELGIAISAGGRDVVQPLFVNLVKRLTGGSDSEAQDPTGMLFGLMVGDLQIKRVIGVSSALSTTEVNDRVEMAFRRTKPPSIPNTRMSAFMKQFNKRPF